LEKLGPEEDFFLLFVAICFIYIYVGWSGVALSVSQVELEIGGVEA
jgi:hypothetical protein